MATRVILSPLAATFNSIVPAELSFIPMDSNDRIPVIRFTPDENRMILWSFVAPQGLTGPLTAILQYVSLNASSGDVSFLVEVEAVTPGDAVQLVTSDFDTPNVGTQTTSSTQLAMKAISITLTNDDGMVAGDLVFLRLTRDINSGLDSTADDCLILSLEFQDSA